MCIKIGGMLVPFRSLETLWIQILIKENQGVNPTTKDTVRYFSK